MHCQVRDAQVTIDRRVAIVCTRPLGHAPQRLHGFCTRQPNDDPRIARRQITSRSLASKICFCPVMFVTVTRAPIPFDSISFREFIPSQ
jgi:hypothetical protein